MACHHSSQFRKGVKFSTCSFCISFATRNWPSTPCATSQRAAYFALAGLDRISSSLSVPQFAKRSSLLYLLQCKRTCLTVCAAWPQSHSGSTPGTPTLASHAFMPMTSVRMRKRAEACAFGSPAYSLRQFCFHGVFQVVGGRRGYSAAACDRLACQALRISFAGGVRLASAFARSLSRAVPGRGVYPALRIRVQTDSATSLILASTWWLLTMRALCSAAAFI